MQRVTAIFILATSVLLFSCKKEHPETTNDNVNSLAGTWDFISIDAQTRCITQTELGAVPQKATSLNYITKNNAGRLIFTDSVITMIGLYYIIASPLTTYTYRNGILGDSAETGYTALIYQPETVCPYKSIGNDSVYFPQGGFINIPASTLTTDPPLGAKISFSGDTVLFKENIYRDSAFVRPQGGFNITYHTIQTGTAVISAVKHR